MTVAARQPPLHSAHLAAGASMVNFAGWDKPVNYGSQIEEHRAVRDDAGMFDISHMLALDLAGPDATTWLRGLLANDVSKLKESGKSLYSCMLNERGGVIDDLIVYRFSDADYRIAVNAGTADKDVAWMRRHIAATGANVTLQARRDPAMIAVKGPRAIERATAPRAEAMWNALATASAKPCGLGARDTLRLEAGMNRYGQDMDDEVSPLNAGLSWTVDRKNEAGDFAGRAALQATPATRRPLGLIHEDKGVLRSHMTVFTAAGEGETISGSFSPSPEKSIVCARLPLATRPGESVEVDIRGKRLTARTVKLPFVRNGKAIVCPPRRPEMAGIFRDRQRDVQPGRSLSRPPSRSENTMSKVPSNLKYTKSHEWVRVEDDGTLTIGVTDHAQEALGDIVFLELPEAGRQLAASEACAVIESVKAASDIYAPVAGEVLAANQDAIDAPESVNADAYANWLFKLKPADGDAVAALMDAAAYETDIAQA